VLEILKTDAVTADLIKSKVIDAQVRACYRLAGLKMMNLLVS
jgi:hypothetical protein